MFGKIRVAPWRLQPVMFQVKDGEHVVAICSDIGAAVDAACNYLTSLRNVQQRDLQRRRMLEKLRSM